MTTASPAACQRVNSRRQPPTLPSSYTTRGDTTGESCRSVAATFGVAPSSVVKWTQRARRTGSVRPAKMGGYRRPILEPYRDWLLEQVRSCPHMTLSGLQGMLSERGVTVSHDTVWRFLRGCGFSFKKSRWSPTSANART
jgi:transposase